MCVVKQLSLRERFLSLRESANSRLLAGVFLALLLRIGLDIALVNRGYFFGKPWDTFTRTYWAWRWAQHPFVSIPDDFWMPLQFWLVGLGYVVRRFLTGAETSSLGVPAITNHLFFIGSLILVSWIALQLNGRRSAFLAPILAASLAGDVWATFSGLSEPMSIFFTLGFSVAFMNWMKHQENPSAQGGDWLWMSLAAILAALTHLSGWFLVVFELGLGGVNAVLALRRRSLKIFPLVLAGLPVFVPLGWLYMNWHDFGDPFHFIHLSTAAQASYAGQESLIRRFLTVPLVTWITTPLLVTVGLIAIFRELRRSGLRHGAYLLPGLVHFALLILTSTLALSAANQEPRYVGVYLWLLIPGVAAWLTDQVPKLVQTAGQRRLMPNLYGWGWWLRVIAIVGIFLVGIWQTFTFQNSFDPQVQQIAVATGEWLASKPGKVLIENISFAERVVIPVIAGYPDRFDRHTSQEIATLLAQPRDQVQVYLVYKPETWSLFPPQANLLACYENYHLVMISP